MSDVRIYNRGTMLVLEINTRNAAAVTFVETTLLDETDQGDYPEHVVVAANKLNMILNAIDAAGLTVQCF